VRAVLDLLIDAATVYPGDAPPFQGLVGVRGAEIVLVTQCHKDSPRPAAHTVVDGRGLLLSPGFIDLHTHSALVSFDDPFLTPKLAQGFTTEVINPDGLSPAPVAPERRAQRQAICACSREEARTAGRGRPWRSTWTRSTRRARRSRSCRRSGTGVRELVLGGDRVQPSPEQLREMCRQVRLGFDAGARTLSFGLVYSPAPTRTRPSSTVAARPPASGRRSFPTSATRVTACWQPSRR
jgi:N-acyl-D-aspartate/D-glutamate deacylase